MGFQSLTFCRELQGFIALPGCREKEEVEKAYFLLCGGFQWSNFCVRIMAGIKRFS